ncbi:hypothetical protein F9K78_13735 [Brucella pseudintermedia]|nr:hypothetical protein F9K78_13735 [Brucella pseudintermedia]
MSASPYRHAARKPGWKCPNHQPDALAPFRDALCFCAHLIRKPFHTFRDALFSQSFTASTDCGWRGFRSETA